MLTGSTQVAQVLIEHGANLNLMDADGKTPLMVGLSTWGARIVELPPYQPLDRWPV